MYRGLNFPHTYLRSTTVLLRLQCMRSRILARRACSIVIIHYVFDIHYQWTKSACCCQCCYIKNIKKPMQYKAKNVDPVLQTRTTNHSEILFNVKLHVLARRSKLSLTCTEHKQCNKCGYGFAYIQYTT